MFGKWIKHYLLAGTIIVVIVALFCSFALIVPNLRKIQEKHEFDSMYEDTAIDFIVPSPSYDQVFQEESDPSNGISFMTPYYSTTTDLTFDETTINSEVLMFPDSNKIEQTPYCSARIVAGSQMLSAGDAVVDQQFVKKNDVSIGDTVRMNVCGVDLSYTIVSISENNLLFDQGSIALVLSDSDMKSFQDADLVYTAAYVEAENYNECKEYLKTTYKPYGRLKPASSFSSEEVYQEHYENFMNADWSKEITNFAENYEYLKVKYTNYETAVFTNQIIAVVIIFLSIMTFQIVALGNSKLNKYMQNYYIKKNGVAAKISRFYISGVIYLGCLCIVILGALYYLFTSDISLTILNIGIMNVLLPVLAIIAVVFLSAVISGITVKGRYSSKKIQAVSKPER